MLATVTAGCGARCAEIAARKRAVIERAEVATGPHAQVVIPFARANHFLAALVHDQPIRAPIELPELGLFGRPTSQLSALVRDVELRPAAAGRLQFAIELEIDDPEQPITTLSVVAEIEPELVRTADASELVAGFGPDNLLAVRPELGRDAGHTLADAVVRWVPRRLADSLPRTVIDRTAEKLAEYLTGKAYDLLRTTLLHRLGELTRLRIRLPALPIAATSVRSTADALTIDLTTDLPVRRGLGPGPVASDEVIVRISQSTAAELANWSIAHGHLPEHYTRSLEPRSDGEYRPWFDYLVDDPGRPVKIHVFQDRGGCSYFEVGLRYEIAIVHDKLEVAVHDRFVESADASTALEIALWLKQLIWGSVDSSYRAAAHTRVTVGGHRFVARILRAAASREELTFTLGFAAPVGAPAS